MWITIYLAVHCFYQTCLSYATGRSKQVTVVNQRCEYHESKLSYCLYQIDVGMKLAAMYIFYSKESSDIPGSAVLSSVE